MLVSEHIEICASDNKKFEGYLALPESKKGPAMLVIQEIFGVNSHIREVCDLYAKAGFVALAPDVFFRIKPGVDIGYGEKDMQEGFGYYQKLDWKQAESDLTDCVKKLRTMPESTGKVGCVGFCMGGNFSYRLAAANAVDAAVSYYGGGIDQNLAVAKQIKTPMIMHFGKRDTHIPTASVGKIRDAVKDNSKVTIYEYDADHGFNCDQRGSYNRPSSMLAFARSYEFLNKNLG